MSSGYNIALVTALRDISSEAFSMSCSEQVEHLSFVTKADLSVAPASVSNAISRHTHRLQTFSQWNIATALTPGKPQVSSRFTHEKLT
ncbi:hypothetical protein [Acetobacter fallax]|uniref:Uncharacterized protein n=1 Tax=Acetobacter fallax TaxID=1737473 RepID=A0ABX0KDK3_9PROT|nr:hypothetical protein [Acetobacter fallax]NHO34495.1 hypothetical protein [Acetobacter fallax]NHO38053.1 hypothetical protein [Acetobacter fallax]